MFDYASLSPAGRNNARHSINKKEARLGQLMVQAAPQAQREVVGWLWAQSCEVYTVKDPCLGLPFSDPRQKFQKVNLLGKAEAHFILQSRQPIVIWFIGVVCLEGMDEVVLWKASAGTVRTPYPLHGYGVLNF